MQSHFCVGEYSMKLLKGWKIRLLAGLAAAISGEQLSAQMMPGSPHPSAAAPYAHPAAYASMPGDEMGQMVDPNLPMIDTGVAYDGSACGCQSEGGMCYGDCDPRCGLLGGGGIRARLAEERCDPFGRSLTGFRHNLFGKLGSCRGILRPYGEGGIATQRWYDASAEVIALTRTKGPSNFVVSSDGISGPVALSTNAVDLDQLRAGLAAQINVQTGPGSNLEFGFFGLNDWDQTATVSDPVNPRYYSFLSNFGVLPPGGFDDSDRSLRHTLRYQSTMNNAEINFRRRWSEPHGFWQGSFLGGFRYFDLDEVANFIARGTNNNGAAATGERFLDYYVRTSNNLFGFQLGGDLWYNLFPGVKLGTELKGGIFHNDSGMKGSIFSNSINNTFQEALTGQGRTAYLLQSSAQLYYRVSYSWALRSSYQVMYIDGLAFATENFNSLPPTNAARVTRLNNKSTAVYQGFTLGAEYTW
jgi:hypothetical protein